VELWIFVAALTAGGILAAAALIIAKKPEAKQLIDKLVPYQGFLGVGLLAWGIINLIRYAKYFGMSLPSAIMATSIFSSILLGFLFGMPLIAKWIPGDTPAEQKVVQVQQKIAGWSVLIGLVGIASAIGLVLVYFEVITVSQ
jgi:hypothetical protein